MLDNTIITKFELSEREKMLKRQFFKREEEPGKKYLFSRPIPTKPEKINNESLNLNSNYLNNTHSLSLEQIQNSNQVNTNINNINNNTEKKTNQILSDSIPDIKNITQKDMEKFYKEAGNYLPKSNGALSQEQINLLMQQSKIMQRNVDALQETNRSLQDFIIYTMKKDSMKKDMNNNIDVISKENNHKYEKLNKILIPLYNQIDNLQSKVKELNEKKRENEINVELDDLIIKNQSNNYKSKNIPKNLSNNKNFVEDSKKNKIMMKTLSNLKGTMSNMAEQMRKIGNNFNEKMQQVLENNENNKLKTIVGGRANSSINNSKINLVGKNLNYGNNIGLSNNNISTFKENGNQNESILKNKLEYIDYENFKSDLLDIGLLKDELENDYKSNAPEFQKLKKPKTKIKFSYNLDNDLDSIKDKKIKYNKDIKINERNRTKPSYMKKNEKMKNESFNKEKEKKTNYKNKDIDKITENVKNNIRNNNQNKKINNINNNINNEDDYENKMKNLNDMSVVDKMNLYKERMSKLSGIYDIKESNKSLNKEINEYNNNNINGINSNHSGLTNQRFYKPSNEINKNTNKYNPPKVKYGVFHGQKGIPYYNPNNIDNEENKEIIKKEIIMPKSEELNNIIKDTIDNYLRAAFNNLKPSEAPEIKLNNENKENNKIEIPPKNLNSVQRVIEREYITNNIKEIVPQNNGEENLNQKITEKNNELIEKFMNLTEKFSNLEKKLSNQMIEQKNYTEKKIEIIEKKVKNEPKKSEVQGQKQKIILPNTDIISKLVMDKIKNQMNIDINLNKKKEKEIPIQQKKVKVEKEQEEKIEIFDKYQKINMEELDEKIRIPHKINLEEYEVSQTYSYLSESLQKNNLNMNNNNQININHTNININEYNEDISNSNNKKYMENSKSEGQISDNDNSSNNNDNNLNYIQNYNNKNKTGIDLKKIKDLNEQIPNQINILQNQNNIVNLPQMSNNNNYNDYLNFLNIDDNSNNYNNNPPKNLNPFNDNINMDGKSSDNFFNNED